MSGGDIIFSVYDHTTVTLSGTVASSNVQLGHLMKQNLTQTVRVAAPAGNTGVVFIRFGNDNSVAATVANDIPILPGTVAGFTVGPGETWMAGILATGTGTIYATCGEGS
jgi:hypothetical protein